MVRSSLTGTMAGQDEQVRNPWVGIVVMSNRLMKRERGMSLTASLHARQYHSSIPACGSVLMGTS